MSQISIKKTYILKDLTEYFYEKLAGVSLQNIEMFMREHKDLISEKCENSLRESVDFNIAKQAGKKINYWGNLADRKGYKLYTLIMTID